MGKNYYHGINDDNNDYNKDDEEDNNDDNNHDNDLFIMLMWRSSVCHVSSSPNFLHDGWRMTDDGRQMTNDGW